MLEQSGASLQLTTMRMHGVSPMDTPQEGGRWLLGLTCALPMNHMIDFILPKRRFGTEVLLRSLLSNAQVDAFCLVLKSYRPKNSVLLEQFEVGE